MMFLTRFDINTARREARKLLGSPQRMHAAVLAGYPPAQLQGNARLLWRVDRAGPHARLYIAGPSAPDLTHLVEQAGWPTKAGWSTLPYDGLLHRLAKGQKWAFRLTANPTRSTRLGMSGRSQRLGHVTVQQQLDWLVARCSNWGIELPASATGPTVGVRERARWQFRRDGVTVTIATATFEGELVVGDPELLRHSLVSGIGPAKAYGCGLMTLAPARSSA